MVLVVQKFNVDSQHPTTYIHRMTDGRRLYSFWIDPDLLAGLKAVQERDGVLPSEQIRRAIAAWLVQKGIAPQPRARKSKRPRR